MKYFAKLDLPTFDLKPQMDEMFSDGRLRWNHMNQICLNTTQGGPDCYLHGTGSLTRDWSKLKIIKNPDGSETQEVPLREPQLKELDFNQLVSVFKNTVFEEVYNLLQEKFTVGRIRLMQSHPSVCMSWHDDASPRIHYPIKTQPGCLMVIDNEVMHIPESQWWFTDTTHYHTALNGSKSNRIHLVAAIFQ